MWNRLWQQTVGSDIPGQRSGIWLRWLLAAFGCGLLIATRPLWLNSGEFPQVPWFAWGCAIPRGVDLCLLALVAGALITMSCASSESHGSRLSLGLFAGAMTGLMLLDQHRTQPWAYQFVLMAIVLATAPHQLAIPLLRLLTIAVYLHSAISKCDYSFCAGLGHSFLVAFAKLAFGPPPAGSPPWQTGAWPLIFSLGELAIALGLVWPASRRWAVWGATGMHALLMLVLGPWGLGHSVGVLIWNGYFIAQNSIIFGRSRILVNPSVAESVTFTRRMRTQWIAIFVISWAALWPFLEPWGWCDVWPAWGLYAQHGEQLAIRITDRGLERLPIPWKDSATQVVGPNEDSWEWQLRLQQESLRLVSAPLYPQNRFQLGVTLALVKNLGIQADDIAAVWYFPANRWTGERRSIRLRSLPEIESTAERCWFNAHPRN